MTFDSVMLCFGIVLESVALFLLVHRRIWRALPLFTIYIAWSILSDLALLIAVSWFAAVYSEAYFYETAIDSLLTFAVLVELTHSVFASIAATRGKRLFRGSTIQIVVVMGLAAVLLWPIAAFIVSHQPFLSGGARLSSQFQFTLSLFRLVCFAAMTFSGKSFAIRGGNLAMQAAAGIGLSSLIGIVVAAIHITRLFHPDVYILLDRAATLSYCATLLYLILCFSRHARLGQNPGGEYDVLT